MWKIFVNLGMLTGRHKRNHCRQIRILASRHTYGHCSIAVWELKRERERSYLEMVRMDFSPKLISRTPSSHPEADVSSPSPHLGDDAIRLTSNDSTNSDPCLEGTAARGGIKPLQQQILRQWTDHMTWPSGCVALTVFPCNLYAGLPRHGDCRCIQSWPHLPSRACLCHCPPWALFWWHPLWEGMWIWTWDRDVLEF